MHKLIILQCFCLLVFGTDVRASRWLGSAASPSQSTLLGLYVSNFVPGLVGEFQVASVPIGVDYTSYGSFFFNPGGSAELDIEWLPVLMDGRLQLRGHAGFGFLKTSSGLLGAWPLMGVIVGWPLIGVMALDGGFDLSVNRSYIVLTPAVFVRLDWSHFFVRLGAEIPVQRYYRADLQGSWESGLTVQMNTGIRW